MMNKVVFRSSIDKNLMRKALIRGTFLASIGVLLLFFSGVFLPVRILQCYGIFLFGLSMLFIAFGLLPYRKLQRLETKPDELWVTNSSIHYIKRGNERLVIPLKAVFKISWVSRGYLYGIGIDLKEHSLLSIPRSFIKYSQKKSGFDLFFPFFTERTFLELKDYIQVS